MTDIIALARRHTHIAPTHYEGCEADHIGCLVHKLADEVERLRADLATQQGCCDGAAAQDAHVRQEREEHRAEVDRLRAEIKRLRAKIKWLIEDDERLHYVLYRIANPPPFADCPVEMAQNATRGEHLRREAFDGIRRALEGKP